MNSVTRFLCVAVAGLVCVGASGDELVFVGSHGTREVVDRKHPGRFGTPPPPVNVLKSGNVSWNIYYEDVVSDSNYGFDDPSQGATRRACAEAVLAYIDAVLNETTGATLDMYFESVNWGGFLADSGTFWSGSVGYDNGFAFEHITTGIDPDPDIVDIYCLISFAYTWNSDHTVAPDATQIDLFSVLLHEMTHGLGILSTSRADGTSLVSDSNPGIYSEWDRLLQFGVGTHCWNSATTALEVPVSAFTSNDIYFGGAAATAAFGSRPPVYAPSTFAFGSSLSHFRTGMVNSVMEHSISAGESKREYLPVDLGALEDIGYANAAALPPPIADFQASAISGSVPLTVTFTDTSANLPSSWAWDLDNDGVTDSTEKNPTHAYTALGTYTVRLTVSNSAGSDEAIKADFITVTTISIVPGAWVEEGTRTALTAGAANALAYQWYKDLVAIDGATGPTYAIDAAVIADSGRYHCHIITVGNANTDTDAIELVVFPIGTLPAMRWSSVVALAALLVALGAVLTQDTESESGSPMPET